MKYVLIGPPAAGKSRVGKRLAHRFELPFIDTDKCIVAEHGPISQIFADHGETYFRDLERESVHDALTQCAVISLGGGAIINEETQKELKAETVILLTVHADAVTDRITNGKRPLVSSIDSWNRLVEARMPLYTSLANFTIDTTNRPLNQVVDEIVQWSKEYGS